MTPHLPLAQSLLDQFPWLSDAGWALGALAMVALAVYFLRPGGDSDFTIHVDDQSVDFHGSIPAGARSAIEEFLLHDVAVPAAYTVRGKWDARILVISVTGGAKPFEQRIRNFLKLQLKPPLRRED